MVIRKNITAGVETECGCTTTIRSFLVKNFTEGNIIVCIDNYNEEQGYKIPSMTAQRIDDIATKIIVKGDNSGEIEIDV